MRVEERHILRPKTMSDIGSSAGSRIKAGSSSLMPSSSKPEFPFKQILEDLFRDGSYSDMEIVCNGFTFKAHRAVVCTQSDFFSAAFKSDFKVSRLPTISLAPRIKIGAEVITRKPSREQSSCLTMTSRLSNGFCHFYTYKSTMKTVT